MKIIFMGTPDFAVPVLESLVNSRHEVVAVYTKPDEEAGRGKKIRFSPVKEAALKYDIPVYQPKGLRKESRVEILRNIEADVIVVCAYGIILRQNVLEMKKYGCINVHASLLPAWRGAAPIQWSILNGDKTTGISIMQMNEGLDTGDIMKVQEIEIGEKETGDSLFEKLSVMGGPLLLEVLDEVENGTTVHVPQGETTTEYAKMLDKSMGLLDFSWPAEKIERYVRGLNSWPGTYTYLRGRLLKIWDATVISGERKGEDGTVVLLDKKHFAVQCGEGYLQVNEVQPEGKKRMETDAFLRGTQVSLGEKLGLSNE